MKRVEGTPWMKVIRQKSLDENLEILMKVADAVAFAHSRGVVHRDLKPENVMLGEFGEVLVMDWGLALLAPRFRHLGSIMQSGGMGGTPAYMAPEMASGPLERIGPASDVYLLGAILYEILAGRPPHAGKDVMSCLYAVAHNEIVPAKQSGELMDIALKAMATEIEGRYASVLDFQSAIRLYHSHSESSLLSNRAEEDLEQATESKDYQDFARSVFGFQEALSLWAGNERARGRLLDAKLAYAECAARKGDLDLGASLLDADEPRFASLRQRIAKAQRERKARQRRLKFFVRTAGALAATIFVVVTAAAFLINAQRREATAQRDRAVQAEAEATQQAQIAAQPRARPRRSATRPLSPKNRPPNSATGPWRLKSRRASNATRLNWPKSRRGPSAIRRWLAEKAEAALREQKEYDAYIAQIGLVAAKIDENAFGYAAELLESCSRKHRNWEWGRLMHLCRQSERTLVEQGGPIEAACYSPDGRRLLTGSWEGNARVWDIATGQSVLNLQHGMYVHAVAFSADGQLIATGSDGDQGQPARLGCRYRRAGGDARRPH